MEDHPIATILQNRVSRRKFLAGVGASAGVAGLAVATGCGATHANSMTTTPPPTQPPPSSDPVTDVDIFNFALNLEYLEAEYYLRAVTGMGLSPSDVGSNPGTVTGGAAVNFKTQIIGAFAAELAADELAHVQFIRKVLGSAAVAEPAIDLMSSFNAAAKAAGIGPAFDPFADEDSFLVGAFVFEDVGVTAYHGAAPLLTKTADLEAAAGIYATEGYHAAGIRTLIAHLGDPYVTLANKIEGLRAAAGGGAETTLSANTIVAADSNSIAYERTTDQVLHIVYLNAGTGVVSKGGFFPNGLNGKITATTK